MADEIIVKMTGFSLSSLMFENEQLNAQYGLLMGYINKEHIKTVTDADMENIQTKRYINVTGVLPIDISFFNNNGSIDNESLVKIIGSDVKSIVGWYRFRRNTDLRLTLREKLIHKHLCNFVEVPVDMLICCISSSKFTKNRSTHTYSKSFYRYDYVQFVEVPLNIPNLGESYQAYKFIGKTSQTTAIDNIIKMSIDPVSSENNLKQMNNGIQQHIDKLVDELCNIENQLLSIKNSKSKIDDPFDQILSKETPEINKNNRNVRTPGTADNNLTNSKTVLSSVNKTPTLPSVGRGKVAKKVLANSLVTTRSRRGPKPSNENMADEC